ncbi:ArsR family transcriptional regulator [bacterium]|nr:MAG: ArsR family transcriptional regulator [bacterium]
MGGHSWNLGGASGEGVMAVSDVFRALGDPVRLTMVRRLTGRGPWTVGSVSEGLGVTRQGARKHLQVLADARLIVLRPKGRETVVSLEPEAFGEATTFLAEIERQWDGRLEALRRSIEEPDL